MNIDRFKLYISERPYISSEYTDEELEKALNFSDKILTIFFQLPEDFTTSSNYEFALFEEAIYILQNDPTAMYLTKYEGLKQFSVAGAITATVAEEYLPYISPLVRKYLEALGIIPIISDNTKISYNYTTF